MTNVDLFILLTGTYLSGGAILSLFVISQGVPEIGPSFIPTLSIIVIMGIVSLSLYFFVIKITDISLCIPMLSFTPVFLILTSSILLNENPPLLGIIGICCIVFGAYLISYSRETGVLYPFRAMTNHMGVAFMLIVALLFAIEVNFDKILVMQSNPIFSAAATFLSFGFAFLLISIIKFRSTNLIRKQNVIMPFVFTGIILAIEALTINYAYTRAIVPYVISVKRISIVFTVLMGGILLNEHDIKRRLLASSIMVLGQYLSHSHKRL